MNKIKAYVDIYLDNNLGDDLFLESLLQRYPQIDFYVPAESKKIELNKSLIKYENLKTNIVVSKKTVNMIKSFDLLILIGGSIFQDLSYDSYIYYFKREMIMRLFKFYNKTIIIMGSNLGPFKTKFGYRNFIRQINLSNYTCVRDKFSYELLKKWKIKSKFEIAPDIVFSLKTPINDLNNEFLGISVINTKLNLEVKQNYINKMVEICQEYLLRNKNNQIKLFSFDSGVENDIVIAEEIISKISSGRERMFLENYLPNTEINDYLKSLKSCKFIIGNRFHSIILALKLNIPFFPILYSNKSKNILEDISYPYDNIEYKDISELNVSKLIDEIELAKRIFTLDSEYKNKSLNHFKGIDNFLSSIKNSTSDSDV